MFLMYHRNANSSFQNNCVFWPLACSPLNVGSWHNPDAPGLLSVGRQNVALPTLGAAWS